MLKGLVVLFTEAFEKAVATPTPTTNWKPFCWGRNPTKREG